MPFTRYQHSCVGRCNRMQSPERPTGHHTANVVTASFPHPSNHCLHQHLGNDILLISVTRASILPTVCDFCRLSLSAKIRLHSEASCATTTLYSANIRWHTEASLTTTCTLPEQHREQFHSSKRNDTNNCAAFPDSIRPMSAFAPKSDHPSLPYILSTIA